MVHSNVRLNQVNGRESQLVLFLRGRNSSDDSAVGGWIHGRDGGQVEQASPRNLGEQDDAREAQQLDLEAQRRAGRERFPSVLMLEPLYTCNLACLGCALERHTGKLSDRLPVESCLKAADDCGVASPHGSKLDRNGNKATTFWRHRRTPCGHSRDVTSYRRGPTRSIPALKSMLKSISSSRNRASPPT